MNLIKALATLGLSALLVACGGGSNAGAPIFGNGGSSATTSDLIVVVSPAQLPNTVSASVKVTVTAIDASRNTLADAPVTLSVDGGGVLSGVSGATTDTSGTVTASLSSGDSRANRLLTVTATSGSVTRTATVQVVGTTVTAVLIPTVAAPSTAGQVQYRVVDSAGNAMAGQAVQVVAPGFTPTEATGTTGPNGDYTFSYTSSAVTGSYTITASIAGVTNVQTVLVQPGSTVPIVTLPITASSVSANPSVVAVNVAGSSTNRSEIRALFLSSGNVPLQNVRARFDLNGDPNSIGGTFTTGAGTLYSDVNGVVTTAYVPAARSSPTDGVNVRVCYGVSDADPNLLNCVTSKLVTLTVTSEPLGVAIGTNALIDTTDPLTYVKEFVISVSDSAGVAKPDVNLAASLDLPNYRKGQYAIVSGKWVKVSNVTCANEDLNRNGVLESGEDINGDGQLWPRKPDVVVSLLQSKTRADGTAVLQIRYARDHGSWVDALITVSASGVAGSEGRASYLVAPVPVDAASITNIAASPAFQISPYGVGAVCTDPN